MERPNDTTTLTCPALRRKRPWLLALVLLTGLPAIGLIPTQTKQGVDAVVSTHTLPLYVKTIEFIQRDISYSRLASALTGERRSPETRALAIFAWTTANIRDTPEGFPVVDDHVWHIILRGYGQSDQKADVFTTLTTYAGVPAFWAVSGDESRRPMSFAWIDGEWKVFDAEAGIAFRDDRGALASAEDLGIAPPVPPAILRAELQMFWPRALHPLKRLVGLDRREWQER